jgi:hypothetical protein
MAGTFAACISLLGLAHAQTVIWSENFDDGNGNNRWYADNGVWQVGAPSYGPATNSAGCRAYSCPNCATTGLTGGYPNLSNSRLIRIQTFTVPSASLFPRLRFWHWFAFGSPTGGGADYGVVEVSVSGGPWQAVSPQYYYSGGDWTYASVDFSAFAGQSVQIAFHLVGQSYSSAPGWYFDNIVFESGMPVLNNPEGWENGIGDWYPDQGIWQVGTPTKSAGAPTNSLGAQAESGTNCAATLLNANYPAYPNSDSRLISPPFILPTISSSPFLRFWHWYSLGPATGGAPDQASVEIRVGTNNWQTISPIYTGNSGSWSEPFIDLSPFAGESVQLAFHVYARSYSSGKGWYVDNVQVYPYTYSAYPPYLLISQSGTNTVATWTWLANYTGFGLQSNTDLLSTNWNPVSSIQAVVNGLNTVTNPVFETKEFYRLIK